MNASSQLRRTEFVGEKITEFKMFDQWLGVTNRNFPTEVKRVLDLARSVGRANAEKYIT